LRLEPHCRVSRDLTRQWAYQRRRAIEEKGRMVLTKSKAKQGDADFRGAERVGYIALYEVFRRAS
jgi:hypothetical protein